MFKHALLAAAPLFLAFPANAETPSAAAPPSWVAPQDLRRHIDVLASDAFEGRKPGTTSEIKTLDYIKAQLAAIGFQGAGDNGGWLQAVPLETRTAGSSKAQIMLKGKRLTIQPGDLVLLGNQPREHISDAPVVYVGHGFVLPAKGIDQLAGVDLKGAVVLMNTGPIHVEGAPRFKARVEALAKAGALAIIQIPGDYPWADVREDSSISEDLKGGFPAATVGAISRDAARTLLGSVPLDDKAEALAAFKPTALPVTASLDVVTNVRRFDSHNLVARFSGSGATGEGVLLLGHWDHLGLCAPEGAADRICNGAVDNASGIASNIEVARHIAEAKPVRDVLFLATTAEEMGLLGAHYFATHPTVPAKSIVAAINNDTIAIHHKGEPVAVLGKGRAELDAVIAATIPEMGRVPDSDEDHEIMVTRQDGWELNKAGIPTVMVGGSFANMPLLKSFLSTVYHKPNDDLNQAIALDGAVEDSDFMIALGRKLADPGLYSPPGR